MAQSSNEHEKVLQAVEQYIAEKHLLPSIQQIKETAGVNKGKISKICCQLESAGKIKQVFSSQGPAKVYLPVPMFEQLLTLQSKPSWISSYEFKEKQALLDKVRKNHKQICEFEKFEQLLYATDTPLEEAVAYAFSFVGFKDVKHLGKDPNKHDIEHPIQRKVRIYEIKGKTGLGDKEEVNQLGGWITKKIADDNLKSEQVEGVFIVNHCRFENPKKRKAPLTPHAKEFLKHHQCKFFTTIFLFDLIKKVVEGELTKEKAQKSILEGMKIE